MSEHDEKPRPKYKGLGVGGFCIPNPTLADRVTHGELQQILAPIREAIALVAVRLGNELGTDDARKIIKLLESPNDR